MEFCMTYLLPLQNNYINLLFFFPSFSFPPSFLRKFEPMSFLSLENFALHNFSKSRKADEYYASRKMEIIVAFSQTPALVPPQEKF